MELGNLPLYIVCGMMMSKHSQYWKSHRYFKTLMIFEFIWYVFCRCILPIPVFFKYDSVLNKIVSFGFMFSSVVWAKNMFHQLKKY
jgi:hypothetical protein